MRAPTSNESWPNDADGDVFRQLRRSRFDFSKSHSVDYNVDFSVWPPAPDAIAWLKAAYGAVSLFPPDGSFGGYAQFQLHGSVTYESVITTQSRVTEAMRPFNGVCESWGVIQDAP